MMKNRKITTLLLIFLTASLLAGFGVYAENAWADQHGTTVTTPPPQTPAPATSRAGAGGDESSVALLAMGIVYVIIWAVQSLMSFLLSLAGNALDYMLTLNINANPVNLPGVQLGWRISRDIANSVFILIVLWIAFKIIFSLENLEGNKTLVRVILLAIFINFSLALVSAVFGISNILARTFSDNLPRVDQKIKVSDFITNALGIQRINQAIDAQTAENLARQNQIRQQNAAGNPLDAAFAPTTTDTFLAAVGIERAQAVNAWCLTSPASCLVDVALESAWLRTLFGVQGNITQNFFAKTLNLAIITILLSVMAATFTLGAVALFIRFFAMTFLSIGAPLALLSAVIPDPQGQTKQLWDWWRKSLVSWAMFAPIFYFLVYLSLVILDEYHTAFGRPLPPQVNLESYIGAFISLGLMIAAYKIARQSGGAVANIAVQWGKIGAGFALGAVTGGVGALGGAGIGLAARRGAPGLEKIISKVSKIPLLGKVTAPVTRRAERFIQQQRDRVRPYKDELKDASDQVVANEFNRSFGARKAAAAAILAERDKLKLIEGRENEALNVTKQFGAHETVLKAKPSLLIGKSLEEVKTLVPDAESLDDAMNKLIGKVDDKTKIAVPTGDDAASAETRDRMLKAVLYNIKGRRELQRIARENQFLYEQLELLWKDKERRKGLDEGLQELDKKQPGAGESKTKLLGTQFGFTPAIIFSSGAGRQTSPANTGRTGGGTSAPPTRSGSEEENVEGTGEAEAPPEKAFHIVQDGRTLRNLDELGEALRNMSDGTFAYYANPRKNDFAKWVREVLENEELARLLEGARNRQEAADIITDYLS